MLCHPYATPIFKSNVLRLVSNEGWVKLSFAAIQMANTALPQSSLVVTGDRFRY